LMAQLALGKRYALERLMELHHRGILELAYRFSGDWGKAEDIAQEAFLRVWRSAKNYKPTARFRTWLYKIVFNLYIDSIKKRNLESGELPDMMDNNAKSPLDLMDAQERALTVQEAVARLPDRQRIALILHRFSGLSISKISEITGDSKSAIESLLVRAYAELRSMLKKLNES